VEYGEPVVLQILLDSGSDANIADQAGKLPLLRAAELGDVTLVLMLIGNGAKIMIEDKDGRSALHQAAKQGHTEVLRHLIDIGANVSAGNRYSYVIFQISEIFFQSTAPRNPYLDLVNNLCIGKLESKL
jgi:ankyrin repeat protein